MQPINTNRAENKALASLTRIQRTITNATIAIRSAANRDLERGVPQSVVQEEYENALGDLAVAAEENYNAIQDLLDFLQRRPLDDNEPVRDECDEWIDAAEFNYPDVQFGGDCADCPGGRRCHASPDFADIDQAIAHASKVPVTWWIESHDCGDTFTVVMCDETG